MHVIKNNSPITYEIDSEVPMEIQSYLPPAGGTVESLRPSEEMFLKTARDISVELTNNRIRVRWFQSNSEDGDEA